MSWPSLLLLLDCFSLLPLLLHFLLFIDFEDTVGDDVGADPPPPVGLLVVGLKVFFPVGELVGALVGADPPPPVGLLVVGLSEGADEVDGFNEGSDEG